MRKTRMRTRRHISRLMLQILTHSLLPQLDRRNVLDIRLAGPIHQRQPLRPPDRHTGSRCEGRIHFSKSWLSYGKKKVRGESGKERI
jgi:hypothetical protein